MVSLTAPEPQLRDDLFFMDLVEFVIEEVSFRVPRAPLELGSAAFFGMCSQTISQSSSTASKDGDAASRPICLEGVTKSEFRSFLRVIYPNIDTRPLDMEDWISVLRLSTLWSFEKLRQQAIEELESHFEIERMMVIDRLVLGKRFHVDSWLRDALHILVSTPPPEFDVEGLLEKVDASLICGILIARERHWASRRCWACGSKRMKTVSETPPEECTDAILSVALTDGKE